MADTRVRRVVVRNDRFRSSFEEREQAREAAGESSWSTRQGERGQQAVYEGRLENHPDWILIAAFDIEMAGVPLVELCLIPATLSPPINGLTVDVLRGIKVGSLHVEVRSWLQLPPNAGPVLDIDRTELGGVRRTGRRGRPPKFYAEWAARYVAAMRDSGPPLQRLALEYHFDPSSIRGFLYEARRRGLLTKAPPGRAGGELTARALELLAEADGVG
jgi:hypothetical protein